MTANQKALWGEIWKSKFYPGQAAVPAVEVIISGKVFTTQHIVVNRKCYDYLPTPTLLIKCDGKRISRDAAHAMLA